MKTDIQHLVIDLKAAIAIGRLESIQVALNGLRAIPEIASNQRLSTSFVKQNLIPIGEILGGEKVPHTFLNSLLNDPYAAIRAVAAISLAVRFCNNPTANQNLLKQAGLDKRKEVRTSLSLELLEKSHAYRNNFLLLCQDWLTSPSSKLNEIALTVLPNLTKQNIKTIKPLLFKLAKNPDSNIKESLANALIRIANQSQARLVLDVLDELVTITPPDLWLISRILSSPWVAKYADRAQRIVKRLESQIGRTREVMKLQKTLQDYLRGTQVEPNDSNM